METTIEIGNRSSLDKYNLTGRTETGQCQGTVSEARWEQGLFALSALSVSDCKTLSA